MLAAGVMGVAAWGRNCWWLIAAAAALGAVVQPSWATSKGYCQATDGLAIAPGEVTFYNSSYGPVLSRPWLWSSDGFTKNFAVYNFAWRGTQADCCRECCTRVSTGAGLPCVKAVYIKSSLSCGLLFVKAGGISSWRFERSSNPNNTVLDGCPRLTALGPAATAAKKMLTSLIPSAIGPNDFTYVAGNSQAARDYLYSPKTKALTGNPLAFSNDALPAPLPGVYQVPVAIGSIAVYMNAGMQLPNGFSLTGEQLCKIFSGKAASWSEIDSGLSRTKLVVVLRSDDSATSGSTHVLVDYLTKACGKDFKLVASAANVVRASGIDGVLTAIKTTAGSIGYAVCGQPGTNAGVLEVPLVNGAKNALTCRQGAYGALSIPQVPSKAGDWAKFSLTGDKGRMSFPLPYVLFAFVRADCSGDATNKAQGVLAKKALTYLNKASVQDFLRSYAYFALPKSLLNAGCATIASVKTYPALPQLQCPQP